MLVPTKPNERRSLDFMPEEPDDDYEDLEGDARGEDTIENPESAVLAAAIEKLIEEDRPSTEDPFADEIATAAPTGSESS